MSTSIVVLPALFGPTKRKNSLSAMLSERSAIAVTSSYDFRSDLISIAVTEFCRHRGSFGINCCTMRERGNVQLVRPAEQAIDDSAIGAVGITDCYNTPAGVSHSALVSITLV